MLSKPICWWSLIWVHLKCMSKDINNIFIFNRWKTMRWTIRSIMMIVFRRRSVIDPVQNSSDRPNVSSTCVTRPSIVWNETNFRCSVTECAVWTLPRNQGWDLIALARVQKKFFTLEYWLSVQYLNPLILIDYQKRQDSTVSSPNEPK